jgi:calcium-dependent protein kinase
MYDPRNTARLITADQVCVLQQVLGKGQFGTTRLATDRKSGQQVACKSISKRKLVSADDIEDVRRQVVD